VRPVARHDAAYFVVDGADVVESLNLAADHFEFLRAEGATVQEFDWHGVETIKLGREFQDRGNIRMGRNQHEILQWAWFKIVDGGRWRHGGQVAGGAYMTVPVVR
jgi:hypothetical protein